MENLQQSFQTYFIDQLTPYANFDGRLDKKRFWMFVLYNFVISVAISVVFGGILRSGWLSSTISGLYSLAILIPSLGISIRRLHDLGKSGMWLLIGLIPLVGWIILIVFYLQDGEPMENSYGPPPAMSEVSIL